jgi:hypothetical protein
MNRPQKLNRLPWTVEVIWLQSRPEIRFKIQDSKRGDVVFRADSPDELLGKVVHAYANELAALETLKTENKLLRNAIRKESV